MAAKPIAMEQLKQVLKLKQEGHSIKSIKRLTGLARNTVKTYLKRMPEATAGTTTDKELAGLFYNQDTALQHSSRLQHLLHHFEGIDKELKRPGVTGQLLWGEYKEQHPDGYAYSQYCEHLNRFLNKKDVVMHLEYNPGEEIMIDFAGKKISYVDTTTGELIPCDVFVATLPYSGLIFCIALEHQKTADLLHGINELLRYLQGVTQTITCDNMRTAVTKADRYEPVFTDLCYQISEHYGTTFSATRPGKPRDKAMVEKAVNLVYKYVYAPLRNQRFTSLSEINYHLRIQVDQLNLSKLPFTPCLLKK